MAVNASAVLNDLTDEATAQNAASGQLLMLAYEQIVGRPPTTAELTLGLQQLQDGTPISALRAYLATTGYAAAAVDQVYTDVTGRAVTAPELASDEQSLADRGSLAGLRSYLATTNEAGGKLETLYTDVVGRTITTGELTGDGAAIGAGTATLASLRSYFATTNEAAGKLQAVYTDVVGRTATPTELSGIEAAIGASTATVAGLRRYFATSNEAVNKLQSLYSAELGRAITPSELTADQQVIAGGASLAAIRTYLSTSTEGVNAFDNEYKNAFGDLPGPADLLSGEQALAGGANLASAVLGTPGTVPFIDAVFQSLLGSAPSASEEAAAEQNLAIDLRGAVNLHNTAGYVPSATTAVTAAAAASPEFANAINAAFQAAIGRPANAVELAADQSELSVPPPGTTAFTLAMLKAQIAELSGGAPPQGVGNVQITPQTIAGSPGFVYGLLNNDALMTSGLTGVQPILNGHGVSRSNVYGFDAATDVLQIESRQAANFAALKVTEVPVSMTGGPSTHIDLGGAATIVLVEFPEALLTAANFRFV